MKRKTQAKPLIFTVDGYTVRSTKLGFLEANEFLFKYLPVIADLTGQFNTAVEDAKEEEAEEAPEINITEVFKKIPKGLISDVCRELLYTTEVLDEEEGNYYLLDPNTFESLGQCFTVIWEVFQFNYPDFFGSGADTQDPSTAPETTKTEEVRILPPTPIENKEDKVRFL